MDKREEIPSDLMDIAVSIEKDIPSRITGENRVFIRAVIARALSQARSQAYEHAAQIAEEWEGPEKLLPMGTKEHNEGASVGMYEAGERIAQAIRQHSQKGGENG